MGLEVLGGPAELRIVELVCVDLGGSARLAADEDPELFVNVGVLILLGLKWPSIVRAQASEASVFFKQS